MTIMMTSFTRHFSDAFFPRLSEYTLAGHLLLLGYILTVNKTLMDNPSISYQLLESLGPQEWWAKVLLVMGTVRFLILVVNGAYRRSPHLRAITAILSCFVWFQVAASFYSIFGWAFAAYAVAAVSDMMNVMRCMRDARIVDDAFKHGASGSGPK